MHFIDFGDECNHRTLKIRFQVVTIINLLTFQDREDQNANKNNRLLIDAVDAIEVIHVLDVFDVLDVLLKSLVAVAGIDSCKPFLG